MMNAILVINPGSTSTKIAIYEDHVAVVEETIRHSIDELSQFNSILEQTNFRYELIRSVVKKSQMASSLAAVVGRGGLLKPIPGGTYLVDESMLADLKAERFNTHASNLGAILANELAKEWQIPAYIVDPVVVDEMMPLARISGLKGIKRRSVGHALNQKAVARQVAKELGKSYETSAIIVAHLGGGISLGAHKNGRMIDVINGLDGEGPYTPERSGSLPVINIVDRVVQERLTLAQVKKMIAGQAGLMSYLGETDIREIQKKIERGDEEAAYYLKGMCYQVAKSIGELAVVLEGEVDGIILTGGVIYSDYVASEISRYIKWIAPVRRYPGEMEMLALYEGASRVIEGQEDALSYDNV